MNKLKYNRKVRILAVILAIICGTLAAAGTATAIFTYEMGLYTKPLDDVIRQKQKTAQEIYSMEIFEHLDEIATKHWTLKNTNLEYGIISTDSLKGLDINDRSLYWDIHFEDTMPGTSYVAKEMHTDDTFSYETRLIPSLTGTNIAQFADGDTNTMELASVRNIFYHTDDGIFYFNTASHSYPVTTIGLHVGDAERKEGISKKDWEAAPPEAYPGESNIPLDENHDRVYFQLNPATKKYVSISGNYKDLDTTSYMSWSKITLDTYSTDTVAISHGGKLLSANKNVKDATLISSDEIAHYQSMLDVDEEESGMNYEKSHALTMTRYSISPGESKTYWIISTVKPMGKWVTQTDLIAKQYHTLTALHRFRYLTLLLTAILAVLAAMAALFCMYSAGYCREQNEYYIFCGRKQDVLLTWRQKLPLELYLIAAGIVFCILFSLMASSAEDLLSGSLPSWLAVTYGGVSLVLTLSCGLAFCMNIAHRIHGGIFGKYTLWSVFWKKARTAGEIIRKNTSLIVKGGILFSGISFLELLALVVLWDHEFLLLVGWCWIKLAELALLVIALIQMKALRESGRELAEGNLSHKMNTDKMLWEFQRHGDHLNQIKEGMAIALEERMKSEHFKTELITNVSHDIKTPLTSLINYVDLLQKDSVTEAEREEYLEVLDRQSKRLKKLIEDLIEASKASTGNLSVNLEPCSLDILLTQTVGEYQEKMSAANLELIVHGSGQGIQIQADSRHLWRVFDNLMNNICKYAQPGTRVYINQELSAGTVSIIFRNTSKESLNISGEELMERFVRGDSSRNTEGSGLGLSIARNLTELMGGHFQIYVDGDLFKVIIRFTA